MSVCSCCTKVIKQRSPVVKDLKGNPLCYRCANYVLYTEQTVLTKDNVTNQHLFSENSNTMFAFCAPVDVRKESTRFLGYSGAWWKVEFYDGSIAYTNNMWCCGDKANIPKALSAKIKPNVKSITSDNSTQTEGLKSMGWFEDVKAEPIDKDWTPF